MVRVVDLAVRVSTLAAPVRQRPLPWAPAVLFGLVAALVYHVSIPVETAADQYVYLADAFLNGRAHLIDPPPHLELTRLGDRHYVIPPPLPAVLLLPYVAVAGSGASQTVAAAAAGGLNALVSFLIAARIAERRADQVWLAALCAFGTIVWHLAAVGSVWFIAHVIATLALNLALLETLGPRRPILIGLGVAAAFWTRLPTVLTLPFFIVMTWDRLAPAGLRQWRTIRLGYLNALIAPIAAVVLLNFGYNWLRFETIADVAYRLRNHAALEPWFARGLLHISYIARHLHPLFLATPIVTASPPWVSWSLGGLAIWVTTPAFIFALRAPLDMPGTWAAWAGILPTALAVMSHGWTGMEQFGYRFAVDFYPLLLFLTMSGMRAPLRPMYRAVIAASVLVNVWGVVWTRFGWAVL